MCVSRNQKKEQVEREKHSQTYLRRMGSMPNNGRAERIGEIIRQLRRRRNITQTELGATRYSKSYVSAVEKNTIRRSPEALQFFADQLDELSTTFTSLTEHPKI